MSWEQGGWGSFYMDLYAKNLRQWLVLSKDIDNQRILKSDWKTANFGL